MLDGYTSDINKGKVSFRRKVVIVKLDFLKTWNKKALVIGALAVVLTIVGGTALALGASHLSGSDISQEQAKAAAFAHAGVTETDVLSFQIHKSVEDGSPVYEVEFKTMEKSYDYEIKRKNGEILYFSYDVVSQGDTGSNHKTDNSVTSEPEVSTGGNEGQQTDSSAQVSQTGSSITQEEAKNIALQNAGVKESDVISIWIKEDYDDGRAVYDVEFYVNGIEYDYEIEKSSGKILSSDHDMENDVPSSGKGNEKAISLEKARDLALTRVPGATSKDIRIHLDSDDGRQIYEGEIYYNQMEYEFEIDGLTGTVIEWSSEHRD